MQLGYPTLKKCGLRYQKNLPTFTLIELSIALIIIGLIIGSVLKGGYILDSARTQSVVRQFQEIRSNLDQYYGLYGSWPALDQEASSRFGSNIEYYQSYNSNDATHTAWKTMKYAGMCSSSAPPKSKLGGQFYLETLQHNGKYFHCISLATTHGGSGVLSEKQISQIKETLTGNNETDGNEEVIVQEIGGKYKLSYVFAK